MQIVKIINCEGFEGMQWFLIGFNGPVATLKNCNNFAHFMTAHKSNISPI